MRDVIRKVALYVASALFALGAPASATVMQATFSGTISSGLDETGEYGAAGMLLNGQSFSLQFTYDTTLSIRDQHTTHYLDFNDFAVTETVDQLYGGGYFGNASPVLSTNFTIGTTSHSYAGTLYGVAVGAERDNAFGPSITRSFQAATADRSADPLTGIRNDFNIFMGASGDAQAFAFPCVDQALSATSPLAQFFGAFVVRRYDRNGVLISSIAANLGGGRLDLRVVPPVAPVPLPAAGGMLALALAGLGWQGRRTV